MSLKTSYPDDTSECEKPSGTHPFNVTCKYCQKRVEVTEEYVNHVGVCELEKKKTYKQEFIKTKVLLKNTVMRHHSPNSKVGEVGQDLRGHVFSIVGEKDISSFIKEGKCPVCDDILRMGHYDPTHSSIMWFGKKQGNTKKKKSARRFNCFCKYCNNFVDIFSKNYVSHICDFPDGNKKLIDFSDEIFLRIERQPTELFWKRKIWTSVDHSSGLEILKLCDPVNAVRELKRISKLRKDENLTKFEKFWLRRDVLFNIGKRSVQIHPPYIREVNRALFSSFFSDFLIKDQIGGTQTELIEKKTQNKFLSKQTFHGVSSMVFCVCMKGEIFKCEYVMKVSYGLGSGFEDLLDDGDREVRDLKELIKVHLVSDVEHPNILRTLRHFIVKKEDLMHVPLKKLRTQGKEHFAVMIYPKFVQDLAHFLKRSTLPLDKLTVINILAGIISALNEIKKFGIVHCDVKADNVLLDNAFVPYLADFECQKRFEEGENFSMEYPQFCDEPKFRKGGCDHFYPPEIAEAEEGDILDYSKMDIFACGFIAYAMYSRNDPFGDAEPEMRTIENFVKLPKSVPVVIRDLIHKMLILDVKERCGCKEALSVIMKEYKKVLKEEK